MKFRFLAVLITYAIAPAFSFNFTELLNLNSSFYVSWEARVNHIQYEITLFTKKSEDIIASSIALRDRIPNYFDDVSNIVAKNQEFDEMKKYLEELGSEGKNITVCQKVFDSEIGSFTKEMQDYFTKIVKAQIEDVQQHLKASIQELNAIKGALKNNSTGEIEKCQKKESSCKITKRYEKVLDRQFYDNNYLEVEVIPSMIRKVLEAFDENIVAPYWKLNIFARINSCIRDHILSKAK